MDERHYSKDLSSDEGSRSDSPPLNLSNEVSKPQFQQMEEEFFRNLKNVLKSTIEKNADNPNISETLTINISGSGIEYNQNRAKLVSKLRDAIKKMLVKESDLWVGTLDATAIQVKLNGNANDMAERVENSYYGRTNEKEQKKQAESAAKQKRTTIIPERQSIFEQVSEKAFGEFYTKLAESYDYNGNNGNCTLAISLPELSSQEFKIFVEAFKKAREAVKCISKDATDGKRVNVIDLTRYADTKTIKINIENLDPNLREIDYSLQQSFYEKFGMKFVSPKDQRQEGPGLDSFRGELRQRFQAQLKASYPDTHQMIENGGILQRFESDFGTHKVNATISLPLEKIKGDDERNGFIQDVSNLAKHFGKNHDVTFTREGNAIELRFNNVPLGLITPNNLIKESCKSKLLNSGAVRENKRDHNLEDENIWQLHSPKQVDSADDAAKWTEKIGKTNSPRERSANLTTLTGNLDTKEVGSRSRSGSR